MSAQVSTEAFLNAKITILDEELRAKTDKLALLEAYVQQLTAEAQTKDDDDEGN